MAEEPQEVKELIDLFNVQQKEIEVPARILDLLASFIDSSTKLEYEFNKPPFIKMLNDGSYWQFEKSCVRLVTWKHKYKVCLQSLLSIYENSFKMIELQSISEIVNTILYAQNRQRKINLFDVYRKLLFYENLSSYYMNIEQQQQ